MKRATKVAGRQVRRLIVLLSLSSQQVFRATSAVVSSAHTRKPFNVHFRPGRSCLRLETCPCFAAALESVHLRIHYIFLLQDILVLLRLRLLRLLRLLRPLWPLLRRLLIRNATTYTTTTTPTATATAATTPAAATTITTTTTTTTATATATATEALPAQAAANCSRRSTTGQPVEGPTIGDLNRSSVLQTPRFL